ncbi:MAG: chaperonin GroEL, partial [Chloroflexi bacterium]|nr:chaperonin GroEL [Chloroflexota bacterium]
LAALETPLRTICGNAGYDGATVAQLDSAEAGTGIDAHSGQAVDMLAVGIMDVASVVEAALQKAVSSAALTLTIDVLLHQSSPPASYTP